MKKNFRSTFQIWKYSLEAGWPHQGSMLRSQFSAICANFMWNNWRFSKKNNVMIKFLHYLALFWVKKWRKNLKIITSAPVCKKSPKM
jgi:hypothetical protein